MTVKCVLSHLSSQEPNLWKRRVDCHINTLSFCQPIRIMKRFFHTCKTVSSNQRELVFTYYIANSFTAGKVSGEDFFKLLAISCGLKSILSLSWTNWAISHVYKDLQCYEKQKICIFEREIYKQVARQLY